MKNSSLSPPIWGKASAFDVILEGSPHSNTLPLTLQVLNGWEEIDTFS